MYEAYAYNLPNNFGKAELCELSCPEPMNNEHLLNCVYLNEGKVNNGSLEQLRNGNINEKIEVFQILQENTRKRMQFLNIKTQ